MLLALDQVSRVSRLCKAFFQTYYCQVYGGNGIGVPPATLTHCTKNGLQVLQAGIIMLVVLLVYSRCGASSSVYVCL